MAMTKVEAAKLTQDMMLRGVIETVITESMILELLPFMEVIGTALTYNREATLPSASFYDPGDTWTEATPTWTTSSSRPTPTPTTSRPRQLPAAPRAWPTATTRPLSPATLPSTPRVSTASPRRCRRGR